MDVQCNWAKYRLLRSRVRARWTTTVAAAKTVPTAFVMDAMVGRRLDQFKDRKVWHPSSPRTVGDPESGPDFRLNRQDSQIEGWHVPRAAKKRPSQRSAWARASMRSTA